MNSTSTLEKYKASMKEAKSIKRIQEFSAIYPEISQKKLIQDLNKYEIAGIERFSVSSWNQFRMNSMTWALRYVFGFKSRYPKPSFARGKATEKTTENTRKGIGKNDPNPIFQIDCTQQVFKIFKELPFEEDLALADFAEKSPEEFLVSIQQIILDIMDVSEKGNYPEWLDEKTIVKICKKIAKEQAIVNDTYPHVRDYICSLGELQAQQRISLNAIFDLPVGFIGFSDWEAKEFGLDLKTVTKLGDIPENWQKVKINHKCQVAAYSMITGKPFHLVYVAPISKSLLEDIEKEKLVFDLYKHYSQDSKEIAKQYKNVSPTGKGTTAPTVEKFISNFLQPNYKLPEAPNPLKVIELPNMEEAKKYHKFNEATAKSIHRVITGCRKESFNDDLLTYCIDDPDNMMLDVDEKIKINEIWGIGLDVSQEEEEG